MTCRLHTFKTQDHCRLCNPNGLKPEGPKPDQSGVPLVGGKVNRPVVTWPTTMKDLANQPKKPMQENPHFRKRPVVHEAPRIRSQEEQLALPIGEPPAKGRWRRARERLTSPKHLAVAALVLIACGLLLALPAGA